MDSDIEDPTDIGRLLEVATRKEPAVAMCPRCPDEVLVFTFDRPGAEFTCLSCHGWFGFLAPRAAESTPELRERIEQRKAEYKAQREAAGGN